MAESKKGHNFAIQGPTKKKKKYVFAYFLYWCYIYNFKFLAQAIL